MTLQEVMNQIPQKKWSTRVPSVALMLEQDSPVFYDALDDETSAAMLTVKFPSRLWKAKTVPFAIFLRNRKLSSRSA